jgi:DHA1 family tetracycline resistance protein-like MFS transporter
MRTKNKATLGFIFTTLLLDVIGMGIIIPVAPKLIEQLISGDLSQASAYGGWLMFGYAIMQFLFAPILGSLSDRFGRRPILLISLLGMGLDYIFCALSPNIVWLFVGRVIAGVAGASITTASAYIADISDPEKRAQNFGMVGVAFGVGFIVGPVLGGVFSQWGVRAPFWIAAVLSLLNLAYGYFMIPESLPKRMRRRFEWKRANPLGAIKQIKRYPLLMSMLIPLALIYIAGNAVQCTWTFYTMLKFSWSESWVGYSLGFVGLMVALVQGGLIRIVIPAIGQKRAIFFGLILYAIGMFLFAFATNGWMMFAILIPYCLGGVAGPAFQGIIAGQASPAEQGELQGILTSLMSLTSIVGPLVMNNLFAAFTKTGGSIYFPGAPFFVAGILMTFSVLLSFAPLKKLRLQKVES